MKIIVQATFSIQLNRALRHFSFFFFFFHPTIFFTDSSSSFLNLMVLLSVGSFLILTVRLQCDLELNGTVILIEKKKHAELGLYDMSWRDQECTVPD